MCAPSTSSTVDLLHEGEEVSLQRPRGVARRLNAARNLAKLKQGRVSDPAQRVRSPSTLARDRVGARADALGVAHIQTRARAPPHRGVRFWFESMRSVYTLYLV